MGKLNVLFPIETINRELDFRLLLAADCVRPHTRIFIGQHDVLHLASKYMQNGIYMGKNIFPSEFPTETLERYRHVKNRGFSLIWLDEEGGVFRGDESAWKRALKARIDVTCLESDDYMCAWGDFQRDFYRGFEPKCATHIHTTGHPRFDLNKTRYRHYFADDIARIRSRFAPFVLINTNLSLANPGPGIEYAFADFNGWDPTNPQKRIRHIAEYSHLCRILNAFLSLVNRLSLEFPQMNFIIRPHPTEDLSFYKTIFRGVPNIHSVHEGGVSPWLAACEVLIHDGCTTGIEAHLAGTKIINYKSIENADYDPYLPNTVGVRCRSEEETIGCLRDMLERDSLPLPSPPPNARALLGNFDLDAFAGVRAIFDECLDTLSAKSGEFNERAFALADVVRAAKQRAKDIVRPYIPARMKRSYQGVKWARTFSQMFYGFQEKSIRAKLARVEQILDKRVRLGFHGPELMTIEHQ